MMKAYESGTDPFIALLDWRNCPSGDLGVSPVQLLMGRRTRSLLPTASTLLSTSTAQAARAALTEAKHRQSFYYNRRAKPRPTLPVDLQTVRMRFDEGDWRRAEILRVLPHRAYQIKLEDGSTMDSLLYASISESMAQLADARRAMSHLRRNHAPLTFNDDAWNGAPTSTDRQPPSAPADISNALAPSCSRPRLSGNVPPSQLDQQQKPSAKADAPDAASKTTREKSTSALSIC